MTVKPSKESLSSVLTFFYKFIFPAIWLGLFGVGSVGILFSEPTVGIQFVIGFFVGLGLFYWICFPLKHVSIGEDCLYVSNYKRTIQIPFSEIQEVTESRLINIHPIWIKFRTTTEFGSTIMFMPYFDFGASFMMSHPVVARLKYLAKLTN